jgi:cytochrome oxidase assembly protein ShyY1
MVALHLLAVAVTVAGVLLGLWQYHVWQQGREVGSASRADARPVPLDDVMTSDAAFPRDGVGRPVRFAGRWLPSSTLYVAGQTSHGRTGVWAVTPVAVCGGTRSCADAPAVLVVRGWAPSRSQAPKAPDGPASVTGWLQPGEGSASPLQVVDQVQHIDRDLYGGYVIAKVSTPREPELGAVTPANLPKPPPSTSLRNLLYALEWWVFAGFAVYAWWHWCRDEVTRVTGVRSSG